MPRPRNTAQSGGDNQSDDSGDDDSGWTQIVPTRRGNRRRMVKRGSQQPTTPQGLNDCLPDDSVEQLRAKFQTVRGQVKSSRFFGKVADIVTEWLVNIGDRDSSLDSSLTSVLCYGLGNPANDKTSLYQLAVLDLLVDACHVDRSSVQLYDPLFRQTARSLLQTDLGFTIIKKNEEGIHRLTDGPTRGPYFIFLPHCAAVLTNNLLYANWDADRLSRTIFFANCWRQSLEQYDGCMAQISALADYPLTYMRRLCDLLEERSVRVVSDALADAGGGGCDAFLSGCFRAMKLQRLCVARVSALGERAREELFRDCGAPVYDRGAAAGDILWNS